MPARSSLCSATAIGLHTEASLLLDLFVAWIEAGHSLHRGNGTTAPVKHHERGLAKHAVALAGIRFGACAPARRRSITSARSSFVPDRSVEFSAATQRNAAPRRQRCGHFSLGLGDSQLMGVIGGRWSNSMVILSVPVAKQPPGWAENRREFTPSQESLLTEAADFQWILVIEARQEIPALADMQPASQAGCLFGGFVNSIESVLVRGDSAPQRKSDARDSPDSSSRNFRGIPGAYRGIAECIRWWARCGEVKDGAIGGAGCARVGAGCGSSGSGVDGAKKGRPCGRPVVNIRLVAGTSLRCGRPR